MNSELKIAFTADSHISSRHPERIESLRYILEDLKKRGPETLFVAGDLLDTESRDYEVVDSLFSKYRDIDIHIVPGNHDIKLGQKHFSAGNVTVYSEPRIRKILGKHVLFIPYIDGSIMGDCIQDFAHKLPKNSWILVSHGDWGHSSASYTPEEKAYFPLTRADFSRFSPEFVILGHIHNNPPREEQVAYPGSSSAVDRNETGVRKYGVYVGNKYYFRDIRSGPVFENEMVLVVPVSGERDLIEKKVVEINEKLKSSFTDHIDRLKLHVKVRGYTASGRGEVKKLLEDKLLVRSSPNIEDLKVVGGDERSAVAEKVSEKIREMKEIPGRFGPSGEEILLKSLEMIYG